MCQGPFREEFVPATLKRRYHYHYALPILHTKCQSKRTKAGMVSGPQNTVPNLDQPKFQIAHFPPNFDRWNFELGVENQRAIMENSLETLRFVFIHTLSTYR